MKSNILSENYLFGKDLPFGGCCPKCGAEVVFYNTAENRKRGQYKCTKCPRDTSWAMGQSITPNDILTKLWGKKDNNYEKI